ncbi:phospholipase [Verticillium dahliae VdLs.17]|uniref:Phospholipase n=1 Tax=Verticillium dahliae (strain VdLs.17 / ATCC MYA-4575 / FGSC 10137) TaxID=498257 RepID=G2X066_VERDV|nr:phospholipase [Verticillium dahliae VdLs.17]EGY21649.1 phospholipase [Verticillium dahliae VdLs.17]KAH6703463.1 phospholipase [Verticillium dahliae]
MQIPDALEALSEYPSSPGDAPDGKYAVRSGKKKHVDSSGPDIEYTSWFRTPSRDQGFCDDKAAGIWTWFEIAIMENADAVTPRVKDDIQLSWSSHKNVLSCEDFTWKNNVIAVRLCSRFQGWKLTAKRGYLVVELGAPIERESLNFGSIAAKVLGTQEALNDINKVMFPTLEQLPSVPDSLFKADMLSTASANDRPLRVLSLDGGGVRGLASLMILKKVMDQSCPGKKPCEVFDMIGGTSTGGFIAIMLGRLEMSVDDCIASYVKFMGQVFPQVQEVKSFAGLVGHFWPSLGTVVKVGVDGEKWDHSVLEKVIKDLIREKLNQDPDSVPLREENNTNPSCKVLWNEVLQVFGPVRTTGCFLSIGTGTPLSQTLSTVNHPIDFTNGLASIATNSEMANILFRSLINAFAPRSMARKYWRFNVGDGLPDWVDEDGVGSWRLLAKVEESNVGELDDVAMIDITRSRAEDYMKEPGFTTLLNECAPALGGGA